MPCMGHAKTGSRYFACWRSSRAYTSRKPSTRRGKHRTGAWRKHQRFSRSHHAGRDADLGFYLIDSDGKPVAAADLTRIDSSLRGLDVPRTWMLVAALLEDNSIDIEWLFVSENIKRALILEAKERGASDGRIKRATKTLHQPSDAPPHDDHLHLRIRCTAAETRGVCRDV